MKLPFVSILFLSLATRYHLNAQEADSAFDLLIRNTTIIDVVSKNVNEHKTIAISGGRIVAIEDTIKSSAKKEIDGAGLIVMPGFVNTHTHLWQHICKSCYPKAKLQEWTRIYRRIHCMEPEELEKVVLAATGEALLSGITTVSDFASLGFNDFANEVNLQTIASSGIGGVVMWSNPTIFLPDWIKEQEITRLQKKFKDHLQIWMAQGPLSFHSLPQVYAGIRLGQKLQMHFSEHTMENIQEQRDFYTSLSRYYQSFADSLHTEDKRFIGELLKVDTPTAADAYVAWQRMATQILERPDSLSRLSEAEKKLLQSAALARIISPMPLLGYLGILRNFLAIHSVWPQPEDIALMKKQQVSVSHNPESNLYLSSGIAPVNSYFDSSVLVTIGTDGAASNDGINFFAAMREMWNLIKLSTMDPAVSGRWSEWDILQAATINGAKALFCDSITGSVSAGKHADLVLLERAKLGLAPLRKNNLVSLIIYSANPSAIAHVLADGKFVVQNGQLSGHREETLAKNLTSIAAAVDQRMDSGKLWSGQYDLNDEKISPYWYAYRSVRDRDSIYLAIRNVSKKTMNMRIMASGATFGGGLPDVADREVNKRFPNKRPAKAFEVPVSLKPNQQVTISKARGDSIHVYNITYNKKRLTKNSGAGQLLIYTSP